MRRVLLVALLCAVALVGIVDYATGPNLSLAAFYTLIVVVAAFISPRFGLVLAVVCAGMWEAGEALRFNTRMLDWLDWWNAVARFVVLAVITLLVHRILALLAEAYASERRSREFLAFAAHQLRTPVAAIQNSSEALLLEDASPAQEELLGNIARETTRAGRLVASLTRIARLDHGEQARWIPVDLRALCGEEVQRARHVHTATFDLTLDERLPERVLVDADGLREALTNVLDNAGRHAVQRVDVRVFVRDRSMVLAVQDDGVGVPRGMEERVFERFVSLDQGGGTGLGLAIAKELARRGGGDVVYADGVFELSVPLATRRT